MNEKLEKNENKKTADVLRAENLVRDYVQYGEVGESSKQSVFLKGTWKRNRHGNSSTADELSSAL